MKIRIEWAAKMALGWLCYWPVLAITKPRSDAAYLWLLSWAGFYAHDSGFEAWRARRRGA